MQSLKKAQSILEYVIVLTAIVAALLAFLPGKMGGAINNLLGDVKTCIENAAPQQSP